MTQQIPVRRSSPPLVDPRYVLVITKGTSSLKEIQDACHDHKELRFSFSPGLFCPSLDGQPARIEPLTITPVPMGVYPEEYSAEDENPWGVALTAVVSEVTQYSRYFTSPGPDELTIAKVGRKIRISYNYENCSGGFVVGPYDPFINSLSDPTRIYVQGASFYQVASTARDGRVTNHLQPFPEPTEEAMLRGVQFYQRS